MQSSHMTQVDPDNVVYFGSARGHVGRILSNFYQCPIEYKDITYPSVEHAFQAQRFESEEHKRMFATDGPLANWDEAYALLMPPPPNASPAQMENHTTTIQKKQKYWQRGGVSLIGILAKMAVTPQTALAIFGHTAGDLTEQECADLFMQLLRTKYDMLITSEALLSTGDTSVLIETVRNQPEDHTRPSRWGGKVYNGVIYGHNQMGNLLMAIRAELHGSEASVARL